MSEERAVQLVQQARLALASERARRTEPIAIVGMACQLPGGITSPHDLWQLLREGRESVTPIPTDRWEVDGFYDSDPEAPGKSYAKHGSFLHRIDHFEPEVFGISPREANSMDPQQRLLLETTWEALEDAGIAPDSTQGARASVWVGLSLDDYARHTVTSGLKERIDGQAALGSARSVAAGRIAYTFGFVGPAVQVDTACSSSLVALHLACQSLRSGESDLAIVGAANVLCAPESTIALSKLRALSKDGRCKTFSAAADGYGRGEGCVVVVLQRQSHAAEQGHRIHALVRGSAINHDGRSNGLTAPNAAAQEAVLRAALASASLEPGSVQYVEAHGTGTLLGDPIEVGTLARVYGAGRSNQTPLYLGSVKTNLGHLESAAGIAGLLKVVLALKHQLIPGHLHGTPPNPRITWDQLPIAVAHHATAWPAAEGPRLAGLSSFGISGTNAHALVQEAATSSEPATFTRSAELVVFSARTPEALRATIAGLGRHLSGPLEGSSLYGIAHGLFRGRAKWPLRRAVVANSLPHLKQLLAELSALSLDAAPRVAARVRPRLAFVFPHCGGGWLEPSAELYGNEAAFRRVIDECAAALDGPVQHGAALENTVGGSLLARLTAPASELPPATATELDVLHVCSQMALAQLWRSWGVEPDVVVGCGVGEIPAAFAAGLLSLQEAARLALQLSEGNGAAPEHLSWHPTAPSNGVSAIGAVGAAREVPSASSVSQFWSCSTATSLTRTDLTARWAKTLRSPSRSPETLTRLLESGVEAFLELSLVPSPSSTMAATDPTGLRAVTLGSFQPGLNARGALLASAARLHELGFALRTEGLFPEPQRCFDLPTYAWQKKRYWLDLPSNAAGASAGGPGESEPPFAPAKATDAALLSTSTTARQLTLETVGVASTNGDSPSIERVVRSEVARVLELEAPEAVALEVSLGSMGLDSVTALELRTLLEETFATSLPAQLVDLETTPAQLVAHLSHGRTTSLRSNRRVVDCECLRPLPGASHRIYCFHDAGGAADLFSELTVLESCGVEVHTVSLSRGNSPLPDDGAEYLTAVVGYVKARQDKPAILLGHSLGALLAWRVALELEQTGGLQLCVLSAPPHREQSFESVFSKQTQARQSSILERLFATDVALYRSLPSSHRAQIDAPIAVIVGEQDHLVGQTEASSWKGRTSSDFTLASVPGDHFYPRDLQCRAFLEREVATRILASTLRGKVSGETRRTLASTRYR